MLKKKMLEKLELQELPKSRTDAVYRVPHIRYILRARYDQEHKLLVVAFYDREAVMNGFTRPTAVLYQGQKQFQTRIQEYGKVVWRGSRILGALKMASNEGICLRASDEKIIRSHIPEKHFYSLYPKAASTANGDILTYIYAYQTWVLEQRSNKKKAERSEKVDAVMATVPAIPRPFERWAVKEPLQHSRYFVYTRRNKKLAEGFCTHCNGISLIPAEQTKHCGKGVCPACGSAVTFRASGRSSNLYDTGESALLQQAKDGNFLLRFFHHSRSYQSGWDNIRTETYERGRLFFTKEGVILGAYKKGHSAALGRYGWYLCKDTIVGKDTDWDVFVNMGVMREWNLWFAPTFLYPHNMRSMLGKLDMSYSLQKEWCHLSIDPTTSIIQTARYPFLHRLKDAGLIRLEQELYERSFQLNTIKRTGSLHSCLGVRKELLPAMAESDISTDILNVLERMPNPMPDDVKFLAKSRNLTEILDLLEYTTLHKINKYVTAQKDKEENRHGNIPVLWRDYLRLAAEMGYDVSKKSILYPKLILQEHDTLMQLKQIKYDAEIDRQIKELYSPLAQQYSFEDNNYLITVPRDFEDFKNEGVTLLHCVCVNKYYLRHISGSDRIFFLRKQSEPDVPYYTIRYVPSNHAIGECSGYRHKRTDKKIDAFIARWMRYLTESGMVSSQRAA